MPDCAFCEIAAGRGEVREVLRTAEVVAFFPDNPASLGHTLIIPTTHVEDIFTLATETAHVLTDAALKVSQAVRSAFEIDGLNLIQSNGEAATQSVFHLHVHVLPRRSGDDVGPIWPEDKTWSESVLDRAQDSLERALATA